MMRTTLKRLRLPITRFTTIEETAVCDSVIEDVKVRCLMKLFFIERKAYTLYFLLFYKKFGIMD